MGTDIHVFAEVRRNGAWKFLRTGTREFCWSCGGKGDHVELEPVCAACCRVVSEHAAGKCILESTHLTNPKPPVCRRCNGSGMRLDDRIYHERDYDLFGRLSGVRGDGPSLWEDRGVPEDASPRIRMLSDWDVVQKNPNQWVSDWHSHGYASVEELKRHRWGRFETFNKTVRKLAGLAKRLRVEPDELRIVWWFDN